MDRRELSVYAGPDGYSRNGTIYISNSVSIVWRKLLIEKSKLKVGQYYFDIGFGDDPFFTNLLPEPYTHQVEAYDCLFGIINPYAFLSIPLLPVNCFLTFW